MNTTTITPVISAEEAAKITTSVITEGFGACKQAIASCDKNATTIINGCEQDEASLRKRMEDPNISLEEVKIIQDMIDKKRRQQEQALKEQREFNAEIITRVLIGMSIIACAIISLNNTKHAGKCLKAAKAMLPKIGK